MRLGSFKVYSQSLHLWIWSNIYDCIFLLSAFGFCEYALPESTLRAIRLLDGLKLGEKALVVRSLA